MIKNISEYKIKIAVIYTIALFLDRLDLTTVNITLPSMAKSFNVSIVSTDWVSLSFLMALAVSIPINGWLTNKFGAKKIFVTSLCLFGLGASICSLALNLQMLIVLRFIQGFGGGMLIPVGMTLIYHAYDRSEYASITSYMFIPALIAPAIGPFVGGLLIHLLGWRYVFLLPGPITLVLAIMSIKVFHETKKKKDYPLDWLGFMVSSIFFIDAFMTISFIGRSGFTLKNMIALISLLPLFVIFIFNEKRVKNPIIDINLFRNKIFLKANAIQLCFQICHFGAIFLIGIYLQVGVGLSPIVTGDYHGDASYWSYRHKPIFC